MVQPQGSEKQQKERQKPINAKTLKTREVVTMSKLKRLLNAIALVLATAVQVTQGKEIISLLSL